MTLMDKQAWRAILRERRDSLSDEERNHEVAHTHRHVQHFLAHHPQAIVAIYLSVQSEMPVLLPEGHECCVPVMQKNGGLRFAKWNANTPTHRTHFGIVEPLHPVWCVPDMIITPLLGVDKTGYRLGYGQGYYDRYFASEKGCNALRLGVAFVCQQVEVLPHDAHDAPLHMLITAAGVRAFS
jgi:5-formyltetrahydrofolate cyclo-ligase